MVPWCYSILVISRIQQLLFSIQNILDLNEQPSEYSTTKVTNYHTTLEFPDRVTQKTAQKLKLNQTLLHIVLAFFDLKIYYANLSEFNFIMYCSLIAPKLVIKRYDGVIIFFGAACEGMHDHLSLWQNGL